MFIGIDLGTTNSVVYTYKKGEFVPVKIFGNKITPSVVSWNPTSNEIYVGKEAKQRVLIHPETSIVSNKRKMGNRQFRYSINGKKYSPVEVTSFLLKYLVDGASQELGIKIDQAVITVPAYFEQNQKEDTQEAAKLAGLQLLGLQQEPTAAALAYAFDKGKEQTILVYDLGGGTFDVSILELKKNNVFTVKALGGDNHLGGDIFDDAIANYLYFQIKNEFGVDLLETKSKEAKIAIQQLKEIVEQTKINLSSSKKEDIYVPNFLGRGNFESEISRAKFEELIMPFTLQTTKIVRQTIAKANISTDEINRVICVGGSSNIPLIQNMLEKEIKKPYIAPNVDEIVAQGAAITAKELLNPTSLITNITPFNLGIRLAEDKFGVIIPANSQIPISEEKTYTTNKDYATETDIEVFQGEQQLSSNNTPLGGFLFKGIEKAKAGEAKVQVKFTLNKNDILEIEAIDQSTKQKKELVIEKFNPKPYKPQKGTLINNLKIGVSRIGCDNMGAVLDKMNFKWTLISDSEFSKSSILEQFDIIFINCSAGGSADVNANALRKFVNNGGVLYVSDLSAPQITKAFPNKITFGSGGVPQKVKANIQNQEVRNALNKSITNIYFDLPLWIPISKVDTDVEVYLTAKVNCGDKLFFKKERPIMAGFKQEKGFVVYTAFHNHAQPSKEEMDLLKIIALKPIAVSTKTSLVELQNQLIKK